MFTFNCIDVLKRITAFRSAAFNHLETNGSASSAKHFSWPRRILVLWNIFVDILNEAVEKDSKKRNIGLTSNYLHIFGPLRTFCHALVHGKNGIGSQKNQKHLSSWVQDVVHMFHQPPISDRQPRW